MAKGGKRTKLGSSESRIDEKGILDELTLARQLLPVHRPPCEDEEQNGPLSRTLDDVGHVTHGFSI